ncbi:MAG: zf-HC2 domain-containing protein [candidate division KSB1 bacterium]|nr:zf-HC2 domain-containing protein [candidate division KSB1 bacterium]MDZ7346479.1 zf-HC2 domain-containing protein [candidate division KSB1 bacterium]
MSCLKSYNLLSFLTGELSDEEQEEMRLHLQSCSFCQTELGRLAEVHNYLLSMPRPAVPQTLYQEYVFSLRRRFAAPSRTVRFAEGFWEAIKSTALSSKWEWRVARAAAVLMVGLFIGRILWFQNETAVPKAESWSFYEPDIAALDKFFSGSEVLLLTLLNSSPERLQRDDVLLTQQAARALLSQSQPLRRNSVLQEDEILTALLDHLELLLLEISNRDEEEMRASLQDFQQQIRQARILQTFRLVQSRFGRSYREGV